ncbi:hypothetical protein [Massilia sp. YIM B02443]|uniref:hypothetical protein n=1 Tax=Massilia sp. YIM B02443 TaxID=3050127 RepID=UPI0025B68650|nr:hypothetical protein [Massilia sp. YIM B02443]MDN4037315.1 hypothetical protein [Massilia sp. YIM B02443]
MKSFLIRPALALALAAGLAGCGGSDKAEFTVAGTIYTLAYDGLKLTNNGGDEISVSPPAKAGDPVNYSFPGRIEYGDVYNVIVSKQPDHQTCRLNTSYPVNSDTAGRLAQISIPYICTINTATIGGKVSGLTVEGLQLANGSTGGVVTLAKDATTYIFPLEVEYNQTYGVTVLKNPAGLNCTVSNPTGTMGDNAVTNIDVACVPAT